MTRAAYRDLLAMARRHAREGVEAEDLLQDAMEAALAAGRAISSDNRAWLKGTIRNIALMKARGEGRRRRREKNFAAMGNSDAPAARDEVPRLDGLPSGLKIVALLAMSGHNRAEIRYLLRISDEALRQRISALRRHLKLAGGKVPAEFAGLHGALAFGSIRRSLLPLARSRAVAFASHDPDGHPIAFVFSGPAPHKTRAAGN